MFLADCHDLIQFRRSAVQMHTDDRLGMRILLKCFLKRLRRHIPGIRLRVNKHRRCILIDDRATRGCKGQRRGKHDISLFHSEQLHRQMNRRRPAGERCAVLHTDVFRDLLLQFIHMRSDRRHPVRVKRLFDHFLLETVVGEAR